MRFTGADGWPCSFEEWLGSIPLQEAVKSLGDGLTIEEIERLSWQIFSASEQGRVAQEPRNTPATEAGATGDLCKLEKHAMALLGATEELRAPAFDALTREGIDLAALQTQLRRLIEYTGHAGGDLRDVKRGAGATPKIRARAVADAAGHVFSIATGNRPTCTTDPISSQVSGAWPDFLDRVFRAFEVKASIASQARAIAENHK